MKREYCPHCNTDLTAEPIPKEYIHLYSATHYSRKIGIYDRELDTTVEYMCPDCKKTWDRWMDIKK